MSNNLPKSYLPRILRKFLELEAASGLVMLFAAAIALVAANTSLSEQYLWLINLPLSVGDASLSIKDFVKDILMVLFFLLVGLELKREMVSGVLASKDQIILPFIAALFGMVVPSIIYAAINYSTPQNMAGFAIPSATDIAFALCILMLVGRGVQPAVKIFLLAIAIFDDLGAIIIIALFYSTGLNLAAIGFAALGIATLFALNRLRVRFISFYILVLVYLWFCFHVAGVHTTVAGVITGLFIPMQDKRGGDNSPVSRAIHFLHPWVGFAILPIFAFVSAGVNFSGVQLSSLLNPLPLGIALALFFGKQIGIFGAVFASVKMGIAKLPDGSSWRDIYGVSVLAGIGFTMSLFIGSLAFPEVMQNEVKIGVIIGSLLSSLLSYMVFSWKKSVV